MATVREKKDINMTIRVTASELEEIKQAAFDRDIPYSELCLTAIREYIGKSKDAPTKEDFQVVLNRLAILEARLLTSV